MAPQLWEIVGGVEKGGIVVRSGGKASSPQLEARLSTGALVEELEVKGDRLHYKLAEGAGPEEGWVAFKITGKELAVKTDKRPKAAVAPAASGGGGADAPKGVAIGKPTKVGPRDEAPLPIAVLFPGQGSQYVNMMAGVKEMPKVKEMIDKAKDILGYDIMDVCLNGPEEKLEETKYCQPAMFLAGLAGLEKLRGDKEEAATRCAVMAGLSLGEYTALCAAGVFFFEDGLRLVKLRGEAMQEAAELRAQGMVSVAGLEKAKLEELCTTAAREEGPDGVCQIANELFPSGFAVGGSKKAIEALRTSAEAAGALQARILKTGGGFHTPLMAPASERLAKALDECLPKMKTPMHTVWLNASAEPAHPGTDPTLIVEMLKKQVTSPVLWEPSIRALLADGITELYEVGPMKQLKAMMKRIDPGAWKKTTNVEV